MFNFHHISSVNINIIFWNLFSYPLINLSVVLGLVNYTGIVGKRGWMKCNTSNWSEDMISLLLWYKGNKGEPIYSIDSRTTTLSSSKHVKSNQRYFLNIKNLPPDLIIDPIEESDQGVYHCRVDYKNDRTQHHFTFLSILVPPQSMLIIDQNGEILEETVGPFHEASYFKAICQAFGGKPSPSLTWWSSNQSLNTSFTYDTNGVVESVLEIGSLSRDDLLRKLECKALVKNTVVAIKTIILDIYLRPLKIKLKRPKNKIFAGQKVELECLSSGSKPPAVITWHKGGRKFIDSITTDYDAESDTTISRLIFFARTEDNKKYISCTAENDLLTSSRLEDSFKLNVYYIPQLTINLGATLKRDSIKEEITVVLECSVKANPKQDDISWTFDGKRLESDGKNNVLISNQSLIIRNVKHIHRGDYRCIARNQAGQSNSDPFFLRVKYSPICKSGQKSVYELSQNEIAEISCEMESDPKDLHFSWLMNTSSNAIEVDSFVVNNSKSVTSYVARDRFGYGTMYCFAENEIGKSKSPCVFHIKPPDPPQNLTNCAITNHSTSTFFVECLAEHNQGTKQMYHLEVYNSVLQTLEKNLTNFNKPTFLVTDLNSGSSFILIIYASNSQGKGYSYHLLGNTLGEPAKQMSRDSLEQISYNSLFVILITVVTIMVTILIIIIVVLRIRSARMAKSNNKAKTKEGFALHNLCSLEESTNGFESPEATESIDGCINIDCNLKTSKMRIKKRRFKIFHKNENRLHYESSFSSQNKVNTMNDQKLYLIKSKVNEATSV